MSHSPKTGKILIVDDAVENIRILVESLKSEYKTVAATNGEKALKLAASENQPDLILLDIIMPGMDGYEVCRRLKADARTMNIPIIFITAISEVMDETRAFRLGAVDYIIKPFHPAVVKARVQTQMKLKRKTDMLEKMAMIDGLTEIPNRRQFDERINNEWNRAKRKGRPLSVILIDIDFFKSVNDNYGHAIGDEYLKKVAQTLSNSLKRATDFIARYGGEEFAVLLADTDAHGAREIAMQLRQQINDLKIPHAFSEIADHLTLSLGLATGKPSGYESIDDLLAEADARLYEAKEQGRNRVVS